MTMCPWCGMESHEDHCPWCHRSKASSPNGTRLGDEPYLSDRTMRGVLGLIGALSVLLAIGMVVWVGIKRAPGQTPTGDDAPPALTRPMLGGKNLSGAAIPNPAPTRGAQRQPSPRSGKLTKTAVAMVPVSEVTTNGVETGSVSIESARLSLFDNGTGKPSLRGEVVVRNFTSATVTKLSLSVSLSDRSYPLYILGPPNIAKRSQSVLAVRAGLPVQATKAPRKEIVLQATLDGPPGAAMDSYGLN